MKQIIIFITVLVLGTTTCNAQFARGFARGAKTATPTTKIFNKYKTPIVAGIVISATQLNQRNRQLQAQNDRLSHACLVPKRVPAPAVPKVEPVKVILPQAPVLARDSVSSNSFRHVLAELPNDTVCVQSQDSIVVIRTD